MHSVSGLLCVVNCCSKFNNNDKKILYICVFRLFDYKRSGDKLNEEETDVAVSRMLTPAADF